MAATILALLLAATVVALAAVAWLFFDGLAAAFDRARAERARLRATTPLDLVVVARQDYGDVLFTVELAPASRWRRLPAFLPGQALTVVEAIDNDRTQKRRYSLAAWQARPHRYRLGIRREAGGAVSPRLYTRLVPGARVQVLPPVGRFVLDPAHRDLVLVGGGVGFTPMAAMLDAVAARPRGHRVWLHHAARGEAELVDRARYEARARASDWFDYRPILSRGGEAWRGARGRLDAARLMDGMPDPLAAHYYFCAREDMMAALMDALAAAGVPPDHLHWESFGGAQNDDRAAYPVEFDGREFSFEGQPSLLAALEDWQVPFDAECRAGECGACRVKLLAGEVAACQTTQCALPPGEILACCCVPRSPLRLARAS